MSCKLIRADFPGRLSHQGLFTNPLECKAAQPFRLVTPGIEVPGIAVLRETLRRYDALALLVTPAAVVTNLQPLTLKERCQYILEHASRHRSACHVLDMYS